MSVIVDVLNVLLDDKRIGATYGFLGVVSGGFVTYWTTRLSLKHQKDNIRLAAITNLEVQNRNTVLPNLSKRMTDFFSQLHGLAMTVMTRPERRDDLPDTQPPISKDIDETKRLYYAFTNYLRRNDILIPKEYAETLTEFAYQLHYVALCVMDYADLRHGPKKRNQYDEAMESDTPVFKRFHMSLWDGELRAKFDEIKSELRAYLRDASHVERKIEISDQKPKSQRAQ